MATDKRFDNLTANSGCTPDAIAWLKTALDPFHDFDVAMSGIPDNDSQMSVIQIIPQTRSFSAPANLAAGETWDLHVCVLPLATTLACQQQYHEEDSAAADPGCRMIPATPQNGSLGTVTVISHGSSSATRSLSFPSYPPVERANADTFVDTTRNFYAVSADDADPASLKKVIAGGFEVHNDTAALYKQGSVTVYSSAQGSTYDYSGYVPLPGLNDYPCAFNRARQPPASKIQASSLPSARTWEAAKGCYVPIRLGDDTHYKGAQQAAFETCDIDTTAALSGSTNLMQGYMQGPITTHKNNYRHRPADLETTGAYFSGLSPETVLTITTKLIVEVAPTNANPTLLFMASPTADFCPKALVLYHEIVSKLPPGVPVAFNAKGDWFRMITGVTAGVAPVLAPLASAINPALGAVVRGAGSAAALANMISKDVRKANAEARNQPQTRGKATSKPNRPPPTKLSRK